MINKKQTEENTKFKLYLITSLKIAVMLIIFTIGVQVQINNLNDKENNDKFYFYASYSDNECISVDSYSQRCPTVCLVKKEGGVTQKLNNQPRNLCEAEQLSADGSSALLKAKKILGEKE